MTTYKIESIAAPIESRMDRIDRRARIKARRAKDARRRARVGKGGV